MSSPSPSRRARRGSRTVRLHQVELEPPKQHAGFLEKKGERGLIKGWKSRWFLLNANKLKYSEKPISAEPLGYIPLADAVITAEPKGAKPLEFHVTVGQRTYELMAPSEEEKVQWLSSIAYSKRYHAERGTTAKVLSGILEERPQQPWDQDEVKDALSDTAMAAGDGEPSMTLTGKELNKLRRMLQVDDSSDAQAPTGDALARPRSPVNKRLSIGSPGQRRASTSLSLRDQELMVVKQLLHEVDETETENTFLQDKLSQTVVTLQEREEAIAALDKELSDTKQHVEQLMQTVEERDNALQQQQKDHEQRLEQLQREKEELEVAKAGVDQALAESQKKHNAAVRAIDSKERQVRELKQTLSMETQTLVEVRQEKERIEREFSDNKQQSSEEAERLSDQLHSTAAALSRTTTQYEATSLELKTTTEERDSLSMSVKELTTTKESLTKLVDQLNVTVEEKETEIAVKERNIQKANTALDTQKEANGQLSTRAAELSRQLEQLQATHSDLMASSSSTQHSLEQRIQSLAAELEQRTSERDSVKSNAVEDKASLEHRLGETKDKLKNTEEQLALAKAQGDRLGQEMEQEKASHAKDLDNWRALDKQKEAEHANAMSAVESKACAAAIEYERRIEALKTETERLETVRRSDASSAQQSHDKLNAAVEDLTTRLKDAVESLHSKDEDCQRLECALIEAREAKESADRRAERELIDSTERHSATVKAMEESMATERVRFAQEKAALVKESEDALAKSRALLNASEQELQTALSVVRGELEEARKENHQRTEENSVLGESVAKLTSELNEARDTLVKTEEEHRKSMAEVVGSHTEQVKQLESLIVDSTDSLNSERTAKKEIEERLSQKCLEAQQLQTSVKESIEEINRITEEFEHHETSLKAQHDAAVAKLQKELESSEQELNREQIAHSHTSKDLHSECQRSKVLEEELSQEKLQRAADQLSSQQALEDLEKKRQQDIRLLEEQLAQQRNDLEGSQRSLEERLTEQLEETKQQLENEKQTVKGKENELEEKQLAMIQLQETVTQIQTQYESKCEEYRSEVQHREKVETTLRTTASQLSESLVDIKNMDEKLTSLQESLLETKATLAAETASRGELTGRLEERQVKLQQLKDELSQECAKRKELEHELQTRSASLSTTSSTLGQQRERISALERQLDEEVAASTLLQEKVNSQSRRCAELETELEKERGNFAGVEKELKEKLHGACSANSDLRGRIESLENDIEAVQKQRTELEAESQERVCSLQRELEELQVKKNNEEEAHHAETTALKDEVLDLKRKAKAQRSAAMRLDEEIQHQAKLVDALQKEKAAYQLRVTEWRALLSEKDSEIAELTRELAQLSESHENLLESKTRADGSLLDEERMRSKVLESETAELRLAFKQRITDCEDQINKLESELRTALEELDKAKDVSPWFAWMEERLRLAEKFGDSAQDRLMHLTEELEYTKLTAHAQSPSVPASPSRSAGSMSPAQARAATVLSTPASPSMTWRGSTWLAEESRVLKAKNARIHELQEELRRVRQQRAETRVKACLEQGVAEEYLEELEEMKREYFFSKAMGMKLNQAQSGMAVTRDIGSLYEHAKNTDFRAWSELLNKYEW